MLAFGLALALGTVMATFRVGPVAPLRWIATAYVELFRNVPLTLQFLLFFFGLTQVGIQFGTFTTAVVVMTLYTGAYVTESVRSGINAVSGGQAEAARSLGLGFTQTVSHIVLPQAFRTVMAPLGNNFIAHHKNTSVAAAISLGDLMFNGGVINTNTANPEMAFLGVAVGYLVVTYPAGLLVGVLERKVAIKR